MGVTVGANQPGAWAEWNYSGYERKPDYPEYHAVIQMMANVGAAQGCGRAMWEYDPSLNRFGTTMSLMLLPYWTNGCVDSMEGLLFESASSTPFHFINQNELSVSPSNAVVGLPYGGLNVPLGIEHLQQMGVKYFLAASSTVETAAAADPSLTEVGSTGPWNTSYNGEALDTTWKVYKVADASVVQPLANRPVVWRGVSPTQSSWLAPAVELVRRSHPVGRGAHRGRSGGLAPGGGRARPGRPRCPSRRRPCRTCVQTDSSISFHVDRVGTPVEVRVSYFPNWKATGADGPWRAAPNLMVVVPTSHDVTLTYGSSPSDEIGQVVSLVSLAAAVAVAVAERRRRRTRSAGCPPRRVGS